VSWEEREWGIIAQWEQSSSFQDEQSLRIEDSKGCPACEYLISLNGILKIG
jgi:hypothetical protein